MIGRIYIIKNTVNDKVYIGQTIKPVTDRFYAHKLCAKETAKTKFYKAMYEIGVDNFYIETIIECDVTPSELTILERDTIIEYDSINKGYNTILPVGSHYNNVDFISERNEEILNDYINNVSYNDICSKYKISKGYISRLCSSFKSKRYREYTGINEKKAVVMYSKDEFKPIRTFESIREAFIYLNSNNDSVNKRAAYYYIEQSCQTGGIAHGFRWQLASDLVYEDKIFRTKFDKEAYIQGKPAYQPEGKQYYIVDGALSFIKNLKLNRCRCISCNKIIKKPGRCKKCYLKLATYSCNEEQCIDRYIKGFKCQVCGLNKALIEGGMCSSCLQVEAKGKSPKPSRGELKALIDQGLQKKQIAEMYGRTDSTVHYWIKSYGLK